MNVAKNLQYLRKRDKITQEELADKLGVSRQSVSKWETGEAYPETEKLLLLCDLFGVSLDGLMRGNLSAEGAKRVECETKGADRKAFAVQIEKFARAVAIGVFLILFGVAACVALTGVSRNQARPLFNFLAAMGGVAVLLFVAAAVFLFIFYGMEFDRFRRENPVMEEPLDEAARRAFSKRFATATACLVAGILLDVVALIVFSVLIKEGILVVSDQNAVCSYFLAGFFAVLAFLVGGLVYFGIERTKYYAEEYNKQARDDLNPAPRKKLADAICASVMMTATALFLVLGFVWGWWHPGWVVFPVGGILCGIIGTVLNAKGPRK